ncbi:hypothetical protein SOVF_077220 [Spinacia oleracea]|uniref:DUF668 domain-containing protein n=1 Tax=Spinacia oleracea TaxID=3562 RepID=A0A9R0JPE3_SPIOL|nr:uncharacterized protein LOC110782394 [Spinacia oleracea]KNA17702.1 hypothetical protein SOVF_077220 [Spinacia oleracea]
MARETITWLSRLKSQISHKLIHPTTKITTRSKSKNVGVLSFEIAGLLSKLLALHHCLSDKNIVRLKNEAISLEGVRKIVSNDENFLLGLACSEMVQSIHVICKTVARLSDRATDLTLRSFYESVEDFASTGRDQHGWAALCGKDFEGLVRRIDRYIAATAALYREIEELNTLQNSLRKTPPDSPGALDVQQKVVWQKQEIKYVKEKSLWNRSYDSAVLLLVRLIFTVLARVKFVFGIGQSYYPLPSTLPRSLSASATVFPHSDLNNNMNSLNSYVSGPLTSTPLRLNKRGVGNGSRTGTRLGFFESKAKDLTPPSTTLGAAALALHYSNLIIVLEKMIKSPHLVGLDAREDVYSMLPHSIRSSLRARLKGVGFSATDPVLAAEWRDALGRILAWLGPLAHNMIKWQSERSFEQQHLMPKSTNVLLLQTLHFANKDKTEAAITELLVGLNYIWRFEREMNAKALLECSNFFFNNKNSSPINLQ